MNNVQFQIVGVLKNKHWKPGKTTVLTSRNLNKSVFIPMGVETTLPNNKATAKQDALSEIVLQIKHSSHMAKAAQVIKRIMESAHRGVDDYQMSSLKSYYNRLIALNIPLT